VKRTLDSLNSVFNSINGVLNASARENLQQSLININRATSSLNNLLNSSTGPLARTLNNAEEMTASLKDNTADIKATINNAKVATEKFSKLDLKPTIDSLNAVVIKLKSISQRIDSKDGTLGALINDRTLYNNINAAIISFETLADDLRANPKRYVNLSIFGRKDRSGPITSPLRKDTVRIGLQ
jgi:phospholipid/cholesterol/gamma-HCH transport system substrate-binding protein